MYIYIGTAKKANTNDGNGNESSNSSDNENIDERSPLSSKKGDTTPNTHIKRISQSFETMMKQKFNQQNSFMQNAINNTFSPAVHPQQRYSHQPIMPMPNGNIFTPSAHHQQQMYMMHQMRTSQQHLFSPSAQQPQQRHIQQISMPNIPMHVITPSANPHQRHIQQMSNPHIFTPSNHLPQQQPYIRQQVSMPNIHAYTPSAYQQYPQKQMAIYHQNNLIKQIQSNNNPMYPIQQPIQQSFQHPMQQPMPIKSPNNNMRTSNHYNPTMIPINESKLSINTNDINSDSEYPL